MDVECLRRTIIKIIGTMTYVGASIFLNLELLIRARNTKKFVNYGGWRVTSRLSRKRRWSRCQTFDHIHLILFALCSVNKFVRNFLFGELIQIVNYLLLMIHERYFRTADPWDLLVREMKKLENEESVEPIAGDNQSPSL